MADKKTEVRQVFTGDSRSLQRASKQAAKSQKQAAGAFTTANAALERQAATLGKVAVGAVAIVGAYKAATASVNFYAKRQQLAAASAGADIGRIQAAARGLITEQEAIAFAAAAMNTEFKLNQKQMEEVAKFMIVLRNQGNDLAAVQQKVTEALVEGNSRKLKEFGVIVDGSSGKLETQRKILAEISKQNLAFGDSLELAGDKASRMGIRVTDAFTRLKLGFGELVADSVGYIDQWGDAIDAVGKKQALATALTFGVYTPEISSNFAKVLASTAEAQFLTIFRDRIRSRRQEFFGALGPVVAAGRRLGQQALGPFEPGSDLNPLRFEPDVLPKRKAKKKGGRGDGTMDFTAGDDIALLESLRQGNLSILRRSFGSESVTDEELYGRFSAESGLARGGIGSGGPDPFGDRFKEANATSRQLSDSLQTVHDIGMSTFLALAASSENFGDALLRASAKAAQGQALNLFGAGLLNVLQGNPAGLAGIAGAAALLALSRQLVPDAPSIQLPGVGAGGVPGTASFGGGGGGGGQTVERIYTVSQPFSDNDRDRRSEFRDFMDRVTDEHGEVGSSRG